MNKNQTHILEDISLNVIDFLTLKDIFLIFKT